MAWLACFIPSYNELFNFVFGPAWMHWGSHALLFAVLSVLLLSLLAPKGGGRWMRVALVFVFVLLAAWSQKRIQWYKSRAWGGDEEMSGSTWAWTSSARCWGCWHGRGREEGSR